MNVESRKNLKRRRSYQSATYPPFSRQGLPKRTRYDVSRIQAIANKGLEKKAYDVAPTVQNVSTSMGFNLLFAPVPGTDYNNRVGRKNHLLSLFLRGFVNLEASATPITGILAEAQLCRIMILWDMQPNGAAPSAADVFTNNTTAYSQLNINNRERFRILKERVIVFDPLVYNTTASQSTAAWNRTLQPIKIYKKLRLDTIFNAGTAGTIADINSGALYLVTIGTVAAGADTDANLYFTTRVRYTDQ